MRARVRDRGYGLGLGFGLGAEQHDQLAMRGVGEEVDLVRVGGRN